MSLGLYIEQTARTERKEVFVFGQKTRRNKTIMERNFDVIIIGCGVAGLYTALNLDPKKRVLMLCKQDMILSNSSLAQGGVATVYDKENDTFESHVHDTFVAGGFRNNPESTHLLVEHGPNEVRALMNDFQVDFDRTADGKIHLTLEGGHSKHRILHHKDCTGREIVEKLIAAVKTRGNITVLEQALVSDVQKVDNGFWINVCQNGEYRSYSGRYCVMATGGIGRVYAFTTNSKIATGDGIAFAYRLGAKIKNLHLVQFHPTAFNNKHKRECFLISEAVRGEGAYLLNCKKERFMDRYDDRLELAPRDVVSHAIMMEEKATGSDHFYLDISRKDPEFIKNRFPMIYQNLLNAGYDMTKEPVPIYPCQHYLMGGINVDTRGRTNVDRLYACGECSHTGVHGNNRLASNSLLEALVFGHQIAQDINGLNPESEPVKPYEFPISTSETPIPQGIRTEVRQIMQKTHFVIPNHEEAVKGLKRVTELKEMLENGNYKVNKDYVQALSLITVAYIILTEVTSPEKCE